MRLLLLAVLSCGCFTHAFSQSEENSFKPADLSVKTYFLKKHPDQVGLNLPFSSIKVIDARFDTSKLGFDNGGNIGITSKNLFKVVTLKGGVAQGLENYYNGTHTSDVKGNGYELLVVLKKFWITSTLPYKIQKISNSDQVNLNTSITAKWELYIGKNDEYLPFRRIDTSIQCRSFTWKSPFHNRAIRNDLMSFYTFIDQFIGKFDYAKAIAVFPGRQKKTLAELISANNTRFNLPIIREDSINKGVFFSFNEFKNNRPAIG